jgi:hypothetical protein
VLDGGRSAAAQRGRAPGRLDGSEGQERAVKSLLSGDLEERQGLRTIRDSPGQRGPGLDYRPSLPPAAHSGEAGGRQPTPSPRWADSPVQSDRGCSPRDGGGGAGRRYVVRVRRSPRLATRVGAGGPAVAEDSRGGDLLGDSPHGTTQARPPRRPSAPTDSAGRGPDATQPPPPPSALTGASDLVCVRPAAGGGGGPAPILPPAHRRSDSAAVAARIPGPPADPRI